MTGITFSKKVFDSQDNLDRFLQGRSSIQEVLAKRKAPSLSNEGQLGTLGIVWVAATEPFVQIYAIFTRATGELLFLFGATKTGSQWIIHSMHLNHRSDVLAWQQRFGNNFLVGCYNVAAQNTHDIYSHPSVDVKTLPSDMQKVIRMSKEALHFDQHDRGKCRGIEDWFAYVYRETRSKFSDPHQHAIAVASLFKDGAPKEAQLLQAAMPDNATCLGFESDLYGSAVFQKDHPKTPLFTDKISRVFASLKPGLYAVGIPRHRMNVIIGKSQSYLHDPNIGLVTMKTSKEISDLWKFMQGWYKFGYVDFKKIKEASPSSAASAA